MRYGEMAEIVGGVRALTDAELTTVAGGGSPNGSPNMWWNIGKVVGSLVGGLVGGPVGAAVGAIDVIVLQACANGDTDVCAQGGAAVTKASPGAAPL
jgi:hypothetical protein